VIAVGSVSTALDRLTKGAARDDRIVLFGSFSLVGEALQWREAQLRTNR